MEPFYVSNKHLERCKHPEKYIKTIPSIFTPYFTVDDMHIITIRDAIPINAAYISNYLIKKYIDIPNIDDNIFFKSSPHFFKFNVSKNCENIDTIKEIVERRSLTKYKHIICIQIIEKLNSETILKLFSILKNNSATALFIISSTFHIPKCIKEIALNIVCYKSADPIVEFFKADDTRENLSYKFISSRIDKLIAAKKLLLYTTELRSFAINITASGIPIMLVIKYIMEYIERQNENIFNYIEILANMEHNYNITSKSIFVLEYHLDVLIKNFINNK